MTGNAAVGVGVGDDAQFGLPWLAAPLQQALDLTRGHALLVHGAAGAGQFEFAQALAQAWLCESSSKPCGRCTGCRQVHARTHPDLFLVVPDALRLQLGWVGDGDPLYAEDAKPSNAVRVDQIRQAIEWSQRTAARSSTKVLVLHPAEAMNGPSANALLKTLEEPPGNLRLVLCADDPARLLPTVRSRCQRLRLALPTRDQAIQWLRGRGVEDADAPLRLAGGSPLLALQYIEDGVDARLTASLPRLLAAGDASALAGRPVALVVDLLLKLAHDQARVALGCESIFFDSASLKSGADLGALQRWQRDLLRASRHNDHPWNAGLMIEALVTEGARAWCRQPDGAPRPPVHSLHSSR
jgi:DNA polymerase-3 subunit delta'